MLGMSVQVHAQAVFDGLEVLIGTPKEPELWRRLAMLQRRNERQRVERREDVDGGTYRASKRAELDGGFTLIDEGHMVNAMTVRGVTSFGSRLGFDSVTEAKKAGWHHFGTRFMDPRRWWGFARGDLEALEQYKTEYIAEAIRRSRL